MSFILDALKKSEAERQRRAGPALLEMRVVRPQRRIPNWVWVGGAVLLLVNLLGVTWLVLRPAATASNTQTAPTVIASMVQPHVIAAAQQPRHRTLLPVTVRMLQRTTPAPPIWRQPSATTLPLRPVT
jgi:general secretion pathway protein B